MINIIPKPNEVIDYNHTRRITEFNIIYHHDFEDALSIFIDEYSDFINSESKYTILFAKTKINHKQGYSIDVLKNTIVVEASSELGMFYATRTLRQIMHKTEKNIIINMCYINDKPKFSYRSFSLDESRHFAGVEEVKKIIDILSLLKIRYLHWHLSDDQGFRVDFKKFPKLCEVGSLRLKTMLNSPKSGLYDETPYQAAYTEEEIIEVIEYAKRRYVSIIPEFDTPGHTASIVASYPYLHCLGNQTQVFTDVAWNTDILCPSKESTYKFLEELFDEIMRLFKDCEYIHLGGDEVIPDNWEKCPDCKAKMAELGITEPLKLQDYFSERLINIVKKYDKKLIMWSDGIHDKVDKDVILQYWTWQMIPDTIEKINNGRATIYSPCCQCYFDNAYAELPLKETYGRGIVLKGLTKKGLGNIFGMECNMWREFIRTNDFMEFMMLPRLHAFSESAWTFAKNRDYKDFKERLKYHNYLMDEMGLVYAKEKIFDYEDKDLSIQNIFRETNRHIEFNKNKVIK